MGSRDDKKQELRNELLATVKARLPRLKKLHAEVSGHTYVDGIYRFYHNSFKVYGLQRYTLKIFGTLHDLLPGIPLDEWFMIIVREGTGKKFKQSHNLVWMYETRPILEAFFHARYFLEMAVKYGEELEQEPTCRPVDISENTNWKGIPSGWAAFLYLYGLR